MEKDNDEDNKELEVFAENNGFNGGFRISAKVGKNINEALEFLICNIIKRMENMESKSENILEKERIKDLALDQNRNNESKSEERKKERKESNDDTIKCSNKDHEDKEAINYCYNCQVYFCDNCSNFHEGILKNHIICSINEISNEIFTGLCKEENHNKLCCGLCICKIKGNGNGQHNDCEICLIKDIKEEKK